MTDGDGVVRVGIGFDVHPREPGRTLMLGGVRWDDEDGLAGHSDGDAACHSLADALLGACALGDVGEHFPESDPDLEGVGGLDLLGRTVETVQAAGFAPASCDLTVICLTPSVGSRRDEIRASIASAVTLEVDQVSVKATRPEGLGLHGDGIGCMAVAVVVPAGVTRQGTADRSSSA